MKKTNITPDVFAVGAQDNTLELFENLYRLPNGISYNSYLIADEKMAVMDTVDKRCTDEWLANLKAALGDRKPDYLVISHMEPDHAASIETLVAEYPDIRLVGNAKTFILCKQFFGTDFADRAVTVKEGDTLELGSHTLRFYLAPMVHWPEVMVSYESSERLLFSADAFGKFGTPDTKEDWTDEARRYYFNIVGKYGKPVQGLLKKVQGLDIKTICPLHGPVLTGDLAPYLNAYDLWSSYRPEKSGVVVAHASIYGHTAEAARYLVDKLEAAGETVVTHDLVREEHAKVLSDAFCYDRLVLLSPTYNGEIFPPMDHFVRLLKEKNYQNRTVGIVENGSWGPMAGQCIEKICSGMLQITLCEPRVTIRSAMTPENKTQLDELAAALKK